jgi:hypothetical protein
VLLITYCLGGFLAQNCFGWKRYANYKEYGSNDEGHAACGRLEISNCDFVTYQASPRYYASDQQGVPRPFLASTIALLGYEDHKKTYWK